MLPVAQAAQTVTRTVTQAATEIVNNVPPSKGPSWGTLVLVAGITAVAAITAAIIAAWSASNRVETELAAAAARTDKELAHGLESLRIQLDHDRERQEAEVRAARRASDRLVLRSLVADAVGAADGVLDAMLAVLAEARKVAAENEEVVSTEYVEATHDLSQSILREESRGFELVVHLGPEHPVVAGHEAMLRDAKDFMAEARELVVRTLDDAAYSKLRQKVRRDGLRALMVASWAAAKLDLDYSKPIPSAVATTADESQD